MSETTENKALLEKYEYDLATRKLEQSMREVQKLFKTEKDSNTSSATPEYVYLLTGFSIGMALTSFVVAIALTRRFKHV